MMQSLSTYINAMSEQSEDAVNATEYKDILNKFMFPLLENSGHCP